MGHSGLSFPGDPPISTCNPGQKSKFLNHLSKTHEDGQVKQADQALRLYAYFLSSREPQTASTEAENSPTAWKDIEEKLKAALRLRHRALSTEKTYLSWFRQFQGFVGYKDSNLLEAKDIQDFLSYLAAERRVSRSTQNQALNALIFLYRHVFGKDLEEQIQKVTANPKRPLPGVLTLREVKAVFEEMSDWHGLMTRLIYGCGLRLQECLNLRIKDVDLEQGVLVVRSGKGDKDRRTLLPESLKDELLSHIAAVQEIYDQDRQNNINGVSLPGALEKKYPHAGKE
jgi:integrase